MASSSGLNTQLRFAVSMGKVPHDHTQGPPPKKSKSKGKKVNAKKGGKKTSTGNGFDSDDITLSSEMSEWLTSTFEETDSEGFLKDSLGSMLTRPLDAMAIFCPTASIISSTTAAPKIPAKANDPRETFDSSSKGFIFGEATQLSKVFEEEEISEPGPTSTELMQSSEFFKEKTLRENAHPPATFKEAADTLEVMWLKRKAQLLEEDGELDEAVKTLDTAIDIHLGVEGAQDYSKAKLADPVVASDPIDLLNEFEETYVPYDVKPHAAAERIQRLYRRYLRKVLKAQTIISKIYRGYHYRQIYRRHLYMKAQCAYLIQRRFRAHLARMIFLANKIKGWYRMRGQMRDYVWRLYFYRLVRRIQCRVRGIKGRKLGYIQRFKITGVISIQRNYRAYRIRRQRFIALAQCHRRLYYAARKIQKRIRIFNAIRKAQGMLVGVSVDEEERMEQEKEIYEESLRIETDKLFLYLKTDAGKLHLQDVKGTINAKDNEFKRIKDTLSQEEIDAHEARVAFELFDTDGSGQIDVDELSAMLTQLCISMDREEVVELAEEMDTDGSGDIDFDEFLDWYTRSANKKGAMLFRQVLKARSAAMEMTGVTLEQRARRDVLRSVTTWIARDTACMYRMKNPPKFSCCRCLEPFVLFSDYFDHFEKGLQCPVMKEQAVYFPDFSNQTEWTYQRMIEADIVRERDEDPCLVHASTMAIYEDLALQQDQGFKTGVESYLSAAKGMWLEKLQEDESLGLGTHIVNIVDISEERILPSYIAKIACKLLGEKIPEKWLAEDTYDLETFAEWAKNLYPDGQPPKESVLEKLKTCLTMNKSINAYADKLGYLYFLCLRMLTIATEAQLTALMTLRKKRPRNMTMTDKQLIDLGLSNLTASAYSEKRDSLVVRLKNLQDKMHELVILSLKPKPPCCEFLAKKTEEYASVAPTDLSEEAFRNLRVMDAHNSASARLRSFLRTRAGKMFIKRLSSELWARRKLIYSQRGATEDAQKYSEIQYAWERLASPVTNEGIDPYDFDLFQNLFSLVISKNDTEKVLKELRVRTTGYIELSPLIRWLASPKSDAHNSSLRRVFTSLVYAIQFILAQVYIEHSKFRCLAQFRKISRLDLELHHKTITRFIKAAEEDKLTQKRLKDGESDSDDEKRERRGGAAKKNGQKIDNNSQKENKKGSSGRGSTKGVDTSKDGTEKGKKERKMSSRKSDSEDEASQSSKSIKKEWGKSVLSSESEDDSLQSSSKNRGKTQRREAEQRTEPSMQQISDSVLDLTEIASPSVKVLSPAEIAAAETADREKEEAMQESLKTLKSEFKAAEERLLFRMTENDAEHQARWRFFTRVGRYQIKHEKMLLRSSGLLFEAYTYCVPPGSTLPTELPMIKAYTKSLSSAEDDQVVEMELTEGDEVLHTEPINLDTEEMINHTYSPPVSQDIVEERASVELEPVIETKVPATSNAVDDDVGEKSIEVVEPAVEPHEDTNALATSNAVDDLGERSIEVDEPAVEPLEDTSALAISNKVDVDGGEDSTLQNVHEMKRNAIGATDSALVMESQEMELQGCATGESSSTEEYVLIHADQSRMTESPPRNDQSDEELIGELHYHHHRLVHTHTVKHEYHHDHIAMAWKLAISMWIYTFDTDCSGTFDESEVNLLLKFLRCGLNERGLLFQFPEVNKDSASLDTLVEYLVTKVFWVKGMPTVLTSLPKFHIWTMSNHRAATMLLISLQRQAARDLAVQTMSTQKGDLSAEEEEEKKNDDAVIIRTQMFAMRQVDMFLKTSFGQLHRAVELEIISYQFTKEVKKTQYSKRGLLRYAYQVHKLQHGMLITELPHLIRFLIRRLKLVPNENITTIATILSAVKSREDLRMLNINETMKIVGPCFDDPCLESSSCSTIISRTAKKLAIRLGVKEDATSCVYAKARQQAIQISLGFEGITAPETNYRCLILGLDALKKKTLKSKFWRGITNFEIGRDKSINWLEVPREATMLLLLSRGYCMKDMTLERTERVVGAYHPTGNLADDLVDIESVIFSSRRDEAMNMHMGQSFYRWCRFPFGLPRYLEYKRTVTILSKHRKEITQIGAMFLKELVEGTSHCGEVEFLVEFVI